jgi:hypothetical protein
VLTGSFLFSLEFVDDVEEAVEAVEDELKRFGSTTGAAAGLTTCFDAGMMP